MGSRYIIVRDTVFVYIYCYMLYCMSVLTYLIIYLFIYTYIYALSHVSLICDGYFIHISTKPSFFIAFEVQG